MKLLDYAALVEMGVANNWSTLNRRIAVEGFPPGRMIGRKRLWSDIDVAAWYEAAPVKNSFSLKGFARPGAPGRMVRPRRVAR